LLPAALGAALGHVVATGKVPSMSALKKLVIELNGTQLEPRRSE
jgi:hypothetical protein